MIDVPEAPESQVMRELVTVLRTHPKVARFVRYNSGGAKIKGFFVRMLVIDGDPKKNGHPDFGGYLTDGRAFYVECKKQSGKVEPVQQEFIDHALKNGCAAFVARSADDLIKQLETV